MAQLPGDLFVLLLPDAPDLRPALAALYRQLAEVTGEMALFMGLSCLAEDCAHYRQALGEARQALEVAQNMRPLLACAISASWVCCACCRGLPTVR